MEDKTSPLEWAIKDLFLSVGVHYDLTISGYFYLESKKDILD